MIEDVHDPDETERQTMSHDELVGYLRELERQAVTFRSTELADEQATAIEYYDAMPFGDEVEGRSQVVVPVVQETVDYMTVSTLRTCVSGDRVVEFEADEAEYEEAASEATEAVNQAFLNDQDGYRVLHSWLQTGLIEKIGFVETACEESEKRRRSTVRLSDDMLAVALSDGANIVESTPLEDGSFLVTIEETETVRKYIDLPIPNHEFLFAPRTRDLDSTEYCAHRTVKTVSELILMGFDRDAVEGAEDDYAYNTIDSRERALWHGEALVGNTDAIPGLRKVLFRKEYARIDYNGDGVAELLRVYRVGNTILDADEVDEQPFVAFCPFPRGHRLVGNSLADKVMDIQRNKSVALRQTFDAFYLSNRPRLWLPEESTGKTTVNDLLMPGPGIIIRGRGSPPVEIGGNYNPSASLSLIEYLTGEQESRTGITRLNQGLDADALNKTATGTALMQAQGQQMEEFVARNFAEAMARLFAKKRRLMKARGETISVRADGDYRQSDPSKWPDDMDVSVRVGLGSGKKEQRLAYRMQILELQKEGLGLGLSNAQKLYNAGAGIVRDAGLGNPNDYFIDPDSEEGAAEQQRISQRPDPESEKASAIVEAAKVKADAELTIAREKADREMQLARERMRAEIELEREKARLETSVAIFNHDGANSIAENRPGGSLSE